MDSRKTVLLVDDSSVNRQILRRILAPDYDIIEVEDGEKALQTYDADPELYTAIILDLMMPVLDGYGFLREFKQRAGADNVPVLVSTDQNNSATEVEVLHQGAWDFVPKPYVPEVIRTRLANAIARSQVAAFRELKYRAEFDPITDIYNRAKFFESTRAMLRNHPELDFTLVRFDINRFHLVNSYFGTETGDDVLRFIGRTMRSAAMESYEVTTFGRLEADDFAFCIPSQNREDIESAINSADDSIRHYPINMELVPSFGICLIDDRTQPVDEICDHAALAAKSIKGSYLVNHAYYTDAMGKAVAHEQELMGLMGAALSEGQFEVWYQPKVDIRLNRPSGAEALVRWRRPGLGMVSPGEFVPVFERNGSIMHLDNYVWERVCRDMRHWIDDGRDPMPVSMNISRVDLADSQLVERITALADKYSVPHNLLHLELTESAYTDNPENTIAMMTAFQKAGFTILMDDFGSGYSSLSVLKDIDVNVLKIDMRFFTQTSVPERGRSIIASVVRMAQWLRMPVVAEGVEEREQVEFLRELGCEYVQGYYYAKPMPAQDYLDFLDTFSTGQVDPSAPIDLDVIWQSDSIIAEALQPLAVFSVLGDDFQIMHANTSFYDMFGYNTPEMNLHNGLDNVDPAYRHRFLDTLHSAIKRSGTAELDYLRKSVGDRVMWVHLKAVYIANTGGRDVLYGAFTDVTNMKQLDAELARYRSIASGTAHSTGRMLIVDDLEMNRSLLSVMFEDRFTILEASNGAEALEMLKKPENRPDIILLDLQMPVMDGHELLARLQADNALAAIPVVIITADDSADMQAQSVAMGASDYIVKPFVRTLVVRRVMNAFEAGRHPVALHTATDLKGRE